MMLLKAVSQLHHHRRRLSSATRIVLFVRCAAPPRHYFQFYKNKSRQHVGSSIIFRLLLYLYLIMKFESYSKRHINIEDVDSVRQYFVYINKLDRVPFPFPKSNDLCVGFSHHNAV
jgi:hypothetical protein